MTDILGYTVPKINFRFRVRDDSIEGPNPYKWEDKDSEQIFMNKKILIFSLSGKSLIVDVIASSAWELPSNDLNTIAGSIFLPELAITAAVKLSLEEETAEISTLAPADVVLLPICLPDIKPAVVLKLSTISALSAVPAINASKFPGVICEACLSTTIVAEFLNKRFELPWSGL